MGISDWCRHKWYRQFDNSAKAGHRNYIIRRTMKAKSTDLEVIVKLDSSVQFPVVIKPLKLKAQHRRQRLDT